MTDWILWAHAVSTLYMIGLIWFVQVVHYPLASEVGPDEFRRYQARHMQRTTWVVAVPMLAEAATATWLVYAAPVGIDPPAARLGLVLLAVVWCSTVAVQVPAHKALTRGFDDGAHRRLVVSNWLRTFAWTARGAVVVWMTAGAGPSLGS